LKVTTTDDQVVIIANEDEQQLQTTGHEKLESRGKCVPFLKIRSLGKFLPLLSSELIREKGM
jgi:hypothetical protein